MSYNPIPLNFVALIDPDLAIGLFGLARGSLRHTTETVGFSRATPKSPALPEAPGWGVQVSGQVRRGVTGPIQSV